MNSVKLSILNKDIQDLEDDFNNYLALKETIGENKKLNVGEYLDKLIAEYMKSIDNKQ